MGEKHIIKYLDYWKLDTVYMPSFNINKKARVAKMVQIRDKLLYDGGSDIVISLRLFENVDNNECSEMRNYAP